MIQTVSIEMKEFWMQTKKQDLGLLSSAVRNLRPIPKCEIQHALLPIQQGERSGPGCICHVVNALSQIWTQHMNPTSRKQQSFYLH